MVEGAHVIQARGRRFPVIREARQPAGAGVEAARLEPEWRELAREASVSGVSKEAFRASLEAYRRRMPLSGR